MTENYVPSLKKTIDSKLDNSISFKIELGYFSTCLTILKVHFSSSIFKRNKIAVGTFGKIFKVEKDDK